MKEHKKYWKEIYVNKKTVWDSSHITPILKAYIDQLTNKNLKILLPGCGRDHEAQYLREQGFNNVMVMDFISKDIGRLLYRYPDVPLRYLMFSDFFIHTGQYDLILEQTFFCFIDSRLRPAYAKKMYDLLNPNGNLSSMLFEFMFDDDIKNNYVNYFKNLFNIRSIESCHNSAETRQKIELFIILEKRDAS